MADDFLLNMDWENFDMGTVTQDTLDRIADPVGRFFLSRTKKEIIKAAIERNIPICSLSSMEDLIQDENLKERNFWIQIEHPELGTRIPYPRQFAKMSEKPISTRFRAPLTGEHNREIYSEIGLTDRDLDVLKQKGVI